MEKEPLSLLKTEDEINREIDKNINTMESYFQCILNFGELLDFTDDTILARLSSINPSFRLETDRNNNLLLRMATHSKTGKLNAKLTGELYIWNKEHELGEVFDSSAGFRMPITNSVKSPDVSFILNSRLEQLQGEDGEDFYKIAPDFVIELRSDTDSIKVTLAKMEEYIENGVRLGWLIDPQTENVHIYRLNGNHTKQSFDEKLSGEDVLPKFELNLRGIFKKK